MKKSPSYFRARIKAIKHLIMTLPPSEVKNSPRELLKQGYIHSDLKDKVEELIKENIDKVSNEPLTFREQTSYSTWFAMHPEKVCGTEHATTSLHFPVTVKGTKEQIVDTIQKGIREQKMSEKDFEFELRLLESELKNLGTPNKSNQKSKR